MSQQSSSAALFQESPSETSYTPVISSSGMSYRPFLELGEGGMSKVFLAHAAGPSGFNKLVVLKSMRPSDLENEAIRAMFADEARLSARLNHPNLVQVQEVNVAAEPPFLVMEYLDGKPLSALRGNERITLGMRLSIISEVLSGLHHAHELCDFDGAPLGIVHRDVSPHNVFVTYDGAVKVLDFGIAKMASHSQRTEAGEVKGKLAYMAPEQMLGSEIDRRADVFSVGSLLWETAVGKRMWDGVADATLMHRLAVGQIPPPSSRAAIDPELEAIIVKATASSPSERFASARELQIELDGYITRAGEHRSLRQISAVLSDAFLAERGRNAELINKALRQSLPPPGAPVAPVDSETNAAELSRPSRAPLFIAAVLGLLAVAGFLAPRIWRAAPDAEPAASAAAKPSIAQPGPRPEPEAGGGKQGDPASGSLGPDSQISATGSTAATDAPPAPSETASTAAAKAARSKAPLRRVAPAAAPASPAVPAEAPGAVGERCSPPYYFVSGIKTYKPECL